ncbi:hypothetical protein chiPu_0019249 [Chiloscyllium punctatum]|uniref:Uncharacterized protein n=1 Tax=Chiloscyllium punctatum TaxID=137246 RepID=A0A401RR75_CHIPU|nr:hypothetical protein [Chiloscyllium punctatum]
MRVWDFTMPRRHLTLTLSNQSEVFDLKYCDLYMKEGAPEDPLIKPQDLPHGKDATLEFSNSPNPNLGITGILTYRYGETDSGFAISFLVPVYHQNIPEIPIFCLQFLPTLQKPILNPDILKHPNADLYSDMIRHPVHSAGGSGFHVTGSSMTPVPDSRLTVTLTDA